MSLPDATWRVYLCEWLIVWTSDADGPEGLDQCWDHFERTYKGRVRGEDRRVVPAIIGAEPGGHPYCLQLWLPNLRGEHKDRDLADCLADEIAEAPPYGGAGLWLEVVQRGSAEEQVLLDYGKKMLPDAG